MKLGDRAICDELLDYAFKLISSENNNDNTILILRSNVIKYRALNAFLNRINTSSSSGKLMLNILLSFAQFEREVSGERIRDKFAALLEKGMWMGGNPHLGYICKDRKLVIDQQKAKIIRFIYAEFV